MAQKAGLTPGATELISKIKFQGWYIFCISTSYEQYAFPITQGLGIPSENVACTSFPLAQIRQLLRRNEFALPYSTLSLASVSLYDLWIVLEAWEKGGRQDVDRVVKEKEQAAGTGDREWFYWLDGTKDITPTLKIHKRIRRLVREEAAKLG